MRKKYRLGLLIITLLFLILICHTGLSAAGESNSNEANRKLLEALGIITDKDAAKKMYDQELIQLTVEKAKEMGYNPISLYSNEKGNIILISGKATLGMKGLVNKDGDMVANVGYRSFKFNNITLHMGEYLVVKNNKFEKQADILKVGSQKQKSKP